MIALILFNAVPLGVALLIGVLTGRWMFARRPAPQPVNPKDASPS